MLPTIISIRPILFALLAAVVGCGGFDERQPEAIQVAEPPAVGRAAVVLAAVPTAGKQDKASCSGCYDLHYGIETYTCCYYASPWRGTCYRECWMSGAVVSAPRRSAR